MVQIDPVREFITTVKWRRYAGATFARAVWVSEGGGQYCLGLRVVLRFAPPAADWEFDAALGSLRITRGWLSRSEARALLAPSSSAALKFPDARVTLSRESPPHYHWSLQPYHPMVRVRIGRPALMLQGSSQAHHQVVGLDNMRALARKFPALRPRAFLDWGQLAAFLGEGGQPFYFDESASAVFEFAAPSLVFIESSHTSATGDVTVAVGSDAAKMPRGASLCLTRHRDTATDVINLADLQIGSTRTYVYNRQFEREAFPVQVRLVADGEAVQDLELIPERTPEEAARLARPSQSTGLVRSQRRSGASPQTAAAENSGVETIRDAGVFCFTDLHAEIRGHCEHMYLSGELESAILTAFKAVEDRLRSLGGCDSELVGVSLVTAVLGTKSPRLRLSAVAAEQEAAHMLFRGAIGLMKNPRSHRFVGDESSIKAFEMLAFASHLMRLLDSVIKPDQSALDLDDTGSTDGPPAS